MQVGLGFMASRTLLAAIEAGLFTELASTGPLGAAALGQRLGWHPRGCRDFFDGLVALGFLTRDAGGAYHNSADADAFLDRRKPGYIGGIFEMAGKRLYPSWANLPAALQTGKPQNELNSEDTFEAMYSDPARLRNFLSAMTGISTGAARAIAAKFVWSDYKTFADVGAAQGATPVQLALAHPHLRGVGYDLPQVRPVFEEYVASHGVQDRVSFQPGDFFRDPLPKVDVLVMGHILHDWDLPTKRMLLTKAFDALPRGGALIVYECLIDDERRTNVSGFMMSLNMLVETPGGFDYTGGDCQGWMREAGFSESWVEPLIGAHAMVVAIK